MSAQILPLKNPTTKKECTSVKATIGKLNFIHSVLTELDKQKLPISIEIARNKHRIEKVAEEFQKIELEVRKKFFETEKDQQGKDVLKTEAIKDAEGKETEQRKYIFLPDVKEEAWKAEYEKLMNTEFDIEYVTILNEQLKNRTVENSDILKALIGTVIPE